MVLNNDSNPDTGIKNGRIGDINGRNEKKEVVP
jgi:hypothetical protein